MTRTIEIGKTKSRKQKFDFCFPDFNFLFFRPGATDIGTQQAINTKSSPTVSFPNVFVGNPEVPAFIIKRGKGECPPPGYCGVSFATIHRPKTIKSVSTTIMITPRADA